MLTLTDFPITKRWPAAHPDRIQVYSNQTANGIKVHIALEEMGLPYELHRVPNGPEGTKSPEFLSLNPNNKVPAIIDPSGPDGETVGIFESGAILIYLAQKTGQLLPSGPARAATLQWLMFQMSAVGPMLGQLGYFHKNAGSQIEDPRPKEHFIAEGRRILAVLEGALEGRAWIVGEFSIADIAIGSWLIWLDFYGTKGVLGWDDNPNLVDYMARYTARPAVQKGRSVPER